MLRSLTRSLARGESLSDDQVSQAVGQLVDSGIPDVDKAEFLQALATKGETVEEICAFVRELRLRGIEPRLDGDVRGGVILDVCGTGGDHQGTFNISTTVALIAAAGGVRVAKHGNRAITSRSGSADVLEALGVRIDLDADEAGTWLEKYHFAFLFAPRFHPAFRHIAAARKLCAERGQRTIFNFLGPLLNPARPTAQLVGVPRPAWCEPMAQALQQLGVRRAMVVSGRTPEGDTAEENPNAMLDELSTLGDTRIAEFHHERGFATSWLSRDGFVIQPATVLDLAGGDGETNARILRRILQGEERGPKRDAVLLNAAAALFVAGTARSLVEGWEVAGELIDGGAARAKLDELADASGGF